MVPLPEKRLIPFPAFAPSRLLQDETGCWMGSTVNPTDFQVISLAEDANWACPRPGRRQVSPKLFDQLV